MSAATTRVAYSESKPPDLCGMVNLYLVDLKNVMIVLARLSTISVSLKYNSGVVP